ncbi:hypothetical protein TcasGA2_TC005220 [Tribolium castaneum]|uniref:Uncharacterized protein n=1 Tax=Tribolium castaneum TaxID=7070 RepID=D6X1J2_TRICA|nr:hypothetical protein TcasGA2_TC005220 [Tribolium castaneum]
MAPQLDNRGGIVRLLRVGRLSFVPLAPTTPWREPEHLISQSHYEQR